MKKLVVSAAVFAGIFLVVAFVSNWPSIKTAE